MTHIIRMILRLLALVWPFIERKYSAMVHAPSAAPIMPRAFVNHPPTAWAVP